MTNGEKYKTAQERAEAFDTFCKNNENDNGLCNTTCPLYRTRNCEFAWLDLEAEEEKPLPCPFCGGKSFIHEESRKKYFAFCGCGYTSSVHKTEEEAIAAHNRVAEKCREGK